MSMRSNTIGTSWDRSKSSAAHSRHAVVNSRICAAICRPSGRRLSVRPARSLMTAPFETIIVNGTPSASMMGRAKSNRRPVTSATSTPAATADATAWMFSGGSSQRELRSVPSISRARSRITCRLWIGSGPRSRLETYLQLSNHLALQDVPEHVLLDLLVAEVHHLHRRGELLARPLHAEAGVDERLRVRRAVVLRGEHVLPERGILVGDRHVREEARVVEVDPDVEPVVRRKVQLGEISRVVRFGVSLPRVVHKRAEVVVHHRVEPQ